MQDIHILPSHFYLEGDVVQIAKKLLGKIIVTAIDQQLTLSRIVETEAYDGRVDKACHAYPNRKTRRTAVMFKEGGRSYVYLCYGIHYLFNVVTHKENEPNAVLLRAVEPIAGIDVMKQRRKINNLVNLTNGPGKLAHALGINRSLNDVVLYDPLSPIWIGEDVKAQEPSEIIQTKRIGVDYAEEDALLPWRFYIKNSLYVSKK
ncbi:MAG TPA: DNA-3-methyladenine glycosylase [Cyclobacteriaceae bacterium]|nr:DNA-3-methyladenine glycosylase [Cyclobacteriaceae bacterium]